MKSSTVALLVASLAVATPAVAQPFAGGGAAPAGMPNLRAIAGHPLPDRGMPAGTVSVRVGRKTPANAVAGVEITIITKNAGGDARMRKGTTDAGGRALFESLAPGDEFHAEVTVDGETLKTDTFAIPAEGGVRTMLIAGLGPASAQESEGAGAGAADGAPAGADGFSLGSATGTAKPEASLPKGTLEVRLFDESGRGVPNQPITLGAVDQTNKVSVLHAQTNGEGTARFTGLATGRTSGYAAVADWHGQHIGTEPFALPEDMGARAEVHALERTSDPAVVAIGEGARIILQLREDTQQFLEMLPLENTSKKMFDPSPGALEIPLPQGFTGAEAGESGNRKLEVRANHGMAVHGPISPKASLGDSDAKASGNEVTFGFVLPYRGGTKDFEQLMPNGIGLFTLIHEQIPGLAISGPGVGAREARELGGKKYWVMPGSAIPAGGVMRFTVTGLPSTDHTGRLIAAILTLALIGAAIAFGRRPRDEARKAGASERERLEARRETLFADLMGVERAARSGAAAATPERRRELVAKLEGVYQQLATLDEPRAS